MTKKTQWILLIALTINLGCKVSKQEQNQTKVNPEKIQVLNFGTFHMGYTTDGSTVEFDERNKKNQAEVHEIAKKIAQFNPTVIIVETPPEYNNTLNDEYESYLNNPNMTFKYPTEIELLAYEIGRLCQTKRIYGIDHKMGYNYRIGSSIHNTVDSVMYNQFFDNPYSFFPSMIENEDSLNLEEKLIQCNQKYYLDFATVINADILTHAGTDNGFEGADEATKFYQRNLRMYTNLNRIELTKDDRVFVLLGSGHTAFFNQFMDRSPKYQLVNTLDFFK